MNCPACQAVLPDGASRCGSCGSPAGPILADTMALPGAAEPHGPPAERAGPGAPIAPGTLVAGRYRIVGLAARGGMGEVYRALDVKLDQPVALKCLPAALADESARLERLLNEVRVARQVSHPNVCRVYDVVEAEGRRFLTMEWIEGTDLASTLRASGRIPVDRAVVIARQVCAGLAAVHDRGVIHRDLKPANVMIDERGVARITDFGLAEVASIRRGWSAREGTPTYMAPEQLAAREVTARSDVYALGLLLYELFTGRPAYGGASLAELTELRRALPVPPSHVASELDPAIDRAVLGCLAADPGRRPASATEVGAALPGAGRLDEAFAVAQRRADRIGAFRDELAELRRAGIVDIDDRELARIERHHDGVLRDLVRHFDVDVTERGKSLSLGMRLVSMVGAVALAASVFYFFFSVWGAFPTALQIAILTVSPIALLVATSVVARREPAAHFATMCAVAAFACVALDVGVIGSLYNMRPSPFPALVCGLFALVAAYGFELRLPLALGVVSLALYAAGVLHGWAGGSWDSAMERPENFFAAGALCLALPLLAPRRHPPGFLPILRLCGMALLLLPPLGLGVAGRLSYLPLATGTIEVLYQLAGGLGGAGAIAFGVLRRSREAAYGGAAFLFLWMNVLFSHWCWELVPKYVFFFVVALAALTSLYLLRRLRAAIAAPSMQGAR